MTRESEGTVSTLLCEVNPSPDQKWRRGSRRGLVWVTGKSACGVRTGELPTRPTVLNPKPECLDVGPVWAVHDLENTRNLCEQRVQGSNPCPEDDGWEMGSTAHLDEEGHASKGWPRTEARKIDGPLPGTTPTSPKMTTVPPTSCLCGSPASRPSVVSSLADPQWCPSPAGPQWCPSPTDRRSWFRGTDPLGRTTGALSKGRKGQGQNSV